MYTIIEAIQLSLAISTIVEKDQMNWIKHWQKWLFLKIKVILGINQVGCNQKYSR
jgi:hypothetical protein